MPARCRSCGAPIIWAMMPSGKRMPLDADPSPDGTVFLHSDGVRAAVLTAEQVASLPAEILRYRSHFASCPNSAQHRRKKESSDE